MKRDKTRIDTVEPPEVGVTPSAVPRRSIRRPGGLPAHLPLRQQVWVLARWPLVEQVLAFAVWFVDVALAGHLSAEATNAIGVGSYVIWLMGLMQGAVGIAATALVARAVGGAHRGLANAAVGQSVLVALIWGAVIALVFFITAPMFATVSNLDPASADLCVLYLRLIAAVAPCMAVLFIGGACLRGAGDFRSTFHVMLVVNIVNVIVSVALVLAPPPVGGHGLRGIAIGTMAGWAVGAVLMLGRLVAGNGRIRLRLLRMRPHAHTLARLVRIAWPAFMDQGGMWVGNFLVIMIVGHLPDAADPQGAHIIAIRIEGFSFLPGFAFAQAAATMVGQYLGAGDRAMANRAAWACWAYGAVFMTALGVLFIAMPEAFVRLVTDKPVFLEQAPQLVRVAGFAQIGFATAMVFGGAMRGAGDTRATMLLNYGSTYLLRLPLVWWVGVELGYGLTGVWIALSVELLIRGVIFLLRWLRGGWDRVRI